MLVTRRRVAPAINYRRRNRLDLELAILGRYLRRAGEGAQPGLSSRFDRLIRRVVKS